MNRIIRNAVVCCTVGLFATSCKKSIVEPQSTQSLTQQTTSQVVNDNEIVRETVTIPITLEDGTQSEVSAVHFYIPKPSGGKLSPKTGVFVPGMAHSAHFFDPLMADLLAKGVYTETFAIDLPGQGRSPIPAGVLFGNISMENYRQALSAFLLAEKRKGLNIVSVTGHSLGALIIEQLQSKLAKGRSGLKSMFGIEQVYLLSSSIPGDTRWAAADTSVAAPGSPKSIILSVLNTTDPMKGPFLDVPAPLYVGFFYGNKLGMPAPGYVAALANKVDQPFKSAAQLIGLDPVTYKDVPRMNVGEDIFEQEELHVIYGSQDPLMQPGEQEAMAENLKSGTVVDVITDTYAVHGVAFTDPTKVSKYYH